MSTAAASRSLLLSQLKKAEEHVATLDHLTSQIREAIAQVDQVIGGTASRRDRAIVVKLEQNLSQLESVVGTMRAALAEGRDFASTLV